MVLFCDKCGKRQIEFSWFCPDCGNKLVNDDVAGIFEAAEIKRFSEWANEFCGNGDEFRHLLQCAGVQEPFFCSACGAEINPFEKEKRN